MKIIVTIPAYNEESSIKQVINSIKEIMNKNKYNYQIIVIDDGSKDKTAETAKKAGAIVYSHPKNYGLAETFRTEIEKCLKHEADIILHTDADGQYLAEDIPRLIKEIENGYDLVLGSRFKGKIEKMPLIKRLGNKAFSKVVSQITGIKITDAQTGLRAFTREVAEKISLVSTHTYTQEQIIRAVRQKFRIKEVPVNFVKRNGKSRLISNPFEYALKAWLNIFRIYRDYEPLKFFGLFGGIVFIIGAVIGFFVLYSFLRFGTVIALPRVLLSVLLLSIGMQFIIFGFIADMIRK